MATVLIGILTPEGTRGGLGKHVKLLTSLFLVCVLIAPLADLIRGLRSLTDGVDPPSAPPLQGEDDYRQEMESALQDASASYFTQMLTQMLESEFGIRTGEVRCNVTWKREEDSLSPTRVCVILSGSAIWKDPSAIENFVSELLGCECVSAIE